MLKSAINKVKFFFDRFADPIRIILLVSAAITGVLLSSAYIINKDEDKAPFHEINWNPKEAIQTLVNKSQAKTRTLADSLRKQYLIMLDKKEAWQNQSDTSRDAKKKTKDSIDDLRKTDSYLAYSLEQAQLKALDKIQQWLYSGSDTAVRKELSNKPSLFIHTNNLSLNNYSFDTINIKPVTVTVNPPFWVTYTSSDLAGGQITDSVTLKINRYTNTENFFNKYPGFALWSLLVIIQTTFYCMLIMGFLFHLLVAPTKDLYKKHIYKPGTILLLLAGMALFVFTIYFRLLNDDKGLDLKGKFFMMDLQEFFFMVNLLGHLAAAFCMVGMITCVMYMNKLKHTIEDPDPAKVVLSPVDIEKLRTEIKRRFKTYFIFIAIILTLAIFTSGTFYSSMNGLEFVKQVIKDQGFSPVNPDMVYIYGILNSFFLVIIYLPLKFILGMLDKSIPVPDGNDEQQGRVDGDKNETDSKEKNPILSTLSKSFTGVKEVLITLSPFLASLLQNLWDLIFS